MTLAITPTDKAMLYSHNSGTERQNEKDVCVCKCVCNLVVSGCDHVDVVADQLEGEPSVHEGEATLEGGRKRGREGGERGREMGRRGVR